MRVVRIEVPELGLDVDRLELGGVSITRLPDIDDVRWPAAALFKSLSADDLKRAEALAPPGTVDAAGGTLRISFNTYLVETPDLVLLVDAGIGNDKERPDRPAWHRRRSPFLETLGALGVPPERVDVVVNTHLHADHVGWNTVHDGKAWVPTFPRARYVIPETELAYWQALHRADPSGQTLHGAFVDSVLPLIEARRVEAVPAPSRIAPGLTVEPAQGHSPGMVVVRLHAGTTDVLFLADVVHHPLQLANSAIVSNFCADPALARDTRHAILSAAAEAGAVLAPYHFPRPAFGRITAEGSAYRFRPLDPSP